MKSDNSLIDDAIDSFASLPGIGRKSAMRLVLHMLDKPLEYTQNFSNSLVQLKERIHPCKKCGNYTELEACEICINDQRSSDTICVVESIRDLLAIEQTGHFRGKYHVLGGLISPLEGIGPSDLSIDALVSRISTDEVKELIMAISPTIDGDTTIYYLAKVLEELPVNISQIARGVSFGGELEYTDELTLSRSIETRLPYTIKPNSPSN